MNGHKNESDFKQRMFSNILIGRSFTPLHIWQNKRRLSSFQSVPVIICVDTEVSLSAWFTFIQPNSLSLYGVRFIVLSCYKRFLMFSDLIFIAFLKYISILFTVFFFFFLDLFVFCGRNLSFSLGKLDTIVHFFIVLPFSLWVNL